MGVDWWKNGHGMSKQNTFDDFVSCARYLIQMNITSPSKLGIQVDFRYHSAFSYSSTTAETLCTYATVFTCSFCSRLGAILSLKNCF